MSTVLEIETAIAGLSIDEMEAIRNHLDDLIEGRLEVNPQFKDKITRAKNEIEPRRRLASPPATSSMSESCIVGLLSWI
jgi:hypothetical protein